MVTTHHSPLSLSSLSSYTIYILLSFSLCFDFFELSPSRVPDFIRFDICACPSHSVALHRIASPSPHRHHSQTCRIETHNLSVSPFGYLPRPPVLVRWSQKSRWWSETILEHPGCSGSGDTESSWSSQSL